MNLDVFITLRLSSGPTQEIFGIHLFSHFVGKSPVRSKRFPDIILRRFSLRISFFFFIVERIFCPRKMENFRLKVLQSFYTQFVYVLFVNSFSFINYFFGYSTVWIKFLINLCTPNIC